MLVAEMLPFFFAVYINYLFGVRTEIVWCLCGVHGRIVLG